MKIGVLGTGYVGLTTGLCMTEIGHSVTCLDIDKEKISKLQDKICPIYEPGMEDLLSRSLDSENIKFTTEYMDLRGMDVIFICVGTPSDEDGSANLEFLWKATTKLAPVLKESTTLVVKSTVPVGTCKKLKEKLWGDMRFPKENVCFNPEFLREGHSIEDFHNSDRIVIGSENQKTFNTMKNLYEALIAKGIPLVEMKTESAELTKYASNCFLATKISFMNEIARFCEKSGANVDEVKKGMGSDKRIGSLFLNAGLGYGGSCFPKDVKALMHLGDQLDSPFSIIKAAEHVNDTQKKWFFKKVTCAFKELSGRKFALWGTAFKPNTDDIRYAPAKWMVKALVDLGAEISYFDPQASKAFEKWVLYDKNFDSQKIVRASSLADSLEGAEAVIICTEWKEFVDFDLSIFKNYTKISHLFDTRNIYHASSFKDLGIVYSSVGR